MKRISMLAVLIAAVWTTLGVGVAFAEEGIPEKIKALETKVGALETKAAASESKVAALEAKLKGVNRSGNLIDFSGVNVKLDNGTGSEYEPFNGLGNLFVGYDSQPFGKAVQTGSHNIILGQENTFESHGDVVLGFLNKAYGNDSFIVGIGDTVARPGYQDLVAGGYNETNEQGSSVTGGLENHADATWSAVSGGEHNHAGCVGKCTSLQSGESAWIGGGEGNTAAGAEGEEARDASVSGGEENKAVGKYSSISGGKLHEAKFEFECTPSCP